MSNAITVRLSNRQIKRDYIRAVRLLNTTQSAVLYRCVIQTIHRAREAFPHAWGLLDDYELLIVEALEEHHTELDQIVRYTRLTKEKVTELLPDLIERGLVIENKREKAEQARGATTKIYAIGKRVLPKQLT
jgi:hypothetical protein